MDHAGRIDRVAGKLVEPGVDGLLVTNLTNVRYLTGFSGTNGQVLVTPRRAVFLSDPRYEARAADIVQGAEVVIYPERMTEALAPLLQDAGIGRLGIEAQTMTVASKEDLAAKLEGIELVGVRDAVESLRRTKDAEEVATLREAVRVADEAFAWAIDRLAPGITERELALDIEVRMRLSGAEDVSFEPIVGSGPLSAHIHHTASDRAFEKGDLVLMDFGARVDGYCSDLTRTIVLGAASDEQRAIYEAVLNAQRIGIDAVADGVQGSEVYVLAVRALDEAGMAEHFTHGLGHGVGLEIHEAPTLKSSYPDVLTVGDVVTVEPGVYIRDSGGIRIEDCVLVTPHGREVLGTAPKDRLLEL